MWLIRFALNRPFTVIVALVGVTLACVLAIRLMPVDIFPSLNLPVIYVAQPYGGMDPAQMEGYLANYYEYHFLYITGIQHVESRNIQGTSLMKLFFHPGTNMAQAMAETVGYVNRARSFMPPGTVPPFIMRFDTGSVPVGYLVLSSETRSIGEIQDLALFRVRPMFASLPGVSAPPPFGGNQRTVVITVDPRASAGLRHDAGRHRQRPGPGQRDQPVRQPSAGREVSLRAGQLGGAQRRRLGDHPAAKRPESARLHPGRGICPGQHR